MECIDLEPLALIAFFVSIAWVLVTLIKIGGGELLGRQFAKTRQHALLLAILKMLEVGKGKLINSKKVIIIKKVKI